ncbi:sugar phosphate isomerase/epimerase [Paenibacillus sp. UMB4589-SE434]|uniref:sugar phosphate isomerase/epimerase family protein n=1 Tax=Paenibacillus sp. UMB4589-SE434 TaxID=3046314 RepID=UPI00254B93A0|nr:sugar phosphate isomerase/epimerase [Paenibacillus sp. UMB4589-SE434]MDK8182160.1 sugar phosphate isomerase/epimerase [Paenibacillus sp. UMB4589-SE434]
MKWTMTTVSFRYHLHSFAELMKFGADAGFQGIELWEPHWTRHADAILDYLQSNQQDALPIRVLSGYQDLTDLAQPTHQWQQQLRHKLEVCQQLNIPVLRLFTGQMSSAEANDSVWQAWLDRLDTLEHMAAERKVQVVFETHPGTLLDQPDAVDRFVKAITTRSWKQIGLNFDVYHVWEFGVDPLDYIQRWFPVIKHIHLKNASKRTSQFVFANVYHPAGDYSDLTELHQGQIDILPIMQYASDSGYNGAVTLEWFGLPSREQYQRELAYLEQVQVPAKQVLL